MTTWSKEEILKVIKSGKSVITQSNGEARDLGMSAANKILDDGKRYRVEVNTYEISVFLPAVEG